MKTVIIFIGLKLAELAGVAVVVYGIYWIGNEVNISLLDRTNEPWAISFLAGAVIVYFGVLLGIALSVVLYGVYLLLGVTLSVAADGLCLLFRANWRKAKELSKKWGKR